jgi:hypothetical protein
MKRRRRGRAAGQEQWNAEKWQRAWDLVMMRIAGMPDVVSRQPAVDHALEMLDGAFAKDDTFQFQLGLLTLMDCCFESIKRGDCEQWWYCQD